MDYLVSGDSVEHHQDASNDNLTIENIMNVAKKETKSSKFKLNKKGTICLSKAEDAVELHGSHTYCKKGLRAHLDYQISNKIKPTCPDGWSDINYIIDEELLSEEGIKKYDKFKVQLKVDQNPHLHWGPRPDCENYVCLIPSRKGKMERAECFGGFEFCIVGHEKWHPNESGRKGKDTGYVKFLRTPEVKNCPKCRSVIQKLEGGNHMTGYQCKYEFGWIGGKHYTSSHFSGMSSGAFAGEKGWEPYVLLLCLPCLVFLLGYFVAFEIIHWLLGDGKMAAVLCGFYLLVIPLGLIFGSLFLLATPFVGLWLSGLLVKIGINKRKFRGRV